MPPFGGIFFIQVLRSSAKQHSRSRTAIVCMMALVYPEAMRTYLLFALIFFWFPASAGIYKWVDENGKVHYSDQEQAGSEEVKLPATATYTPAASTEEKVHKGPDKAHSYTEVSIVQPKINEKLLSYEGDVQVSIELVPGLQSGDSITVYLDDKVLLKGQTQTSLTLVGVNHGSHTLRVTVFDNNAKPLISSKSIIFHLWRSAAGPATDGKTKDNSKAFRPDFARDENKKADYAKDFSRGYGKDFSKKPDSSDSSKDAAKEFNNGIPSNSKTFESGPSDYAPNYDQKK